MQNSPPSAQITDRAGWPRWRLAMPLYPFTAAAAAAIKLFLLSLMLRVLGCGSLSPAEAVMLAVLLGLPAR